MGLQGQEGLWVIEVFVVVFITLLANLIVRRMLNRVALKLEKTKNQWDDILVEASRQPVSMLIWVIGLSWAAMLVDMKSDTSILVAVEPVRDVAVIVLLSWFLIRLVKGGEQAVLEPERFKKPMDETTAHAIGKLLRASIIITTVLVILQSLGYSISGVLAFGGIGGIAVGFAAKDLLANFFGGLMIYLDRPFVVGDWVRSPDQEIEGTVEYIGWRQTRIRTFDKRPLYVPNATFANISVENPSRMKNRRIYEKVGLRYDDAAKVEPVINAVREMLQQHSEIDQRQTLIVNLNSFGASSLDFFIYTFTKTTDWVKFHHIKQDVMLKIMAIVEDHDAEFAFPTSTIHTPDLLNNDKASDLSPANLERFAEMDRVHPES
ncbi:mechanosensitive ion channel family protein [Motiliproteus sp. MSK22-1]|uniref:mechanosensitive ion channel family protein n=1 Tax=Motiliproteus sp. MSK22-1 TaxID=1897630 RepID=UPI000977E7A6|nr:mechanosensitive ion channel family protein [Motiliproteus sp. MSK22-1]OMH34009.1 mechanosensitive ion channel protein MscS [Motiliproteus sp. MSK22-1]